MAFQKGHQLNKGIKPSQKTIDASVLSRKGKKLSQEHKDRIGASLLGIKRVLIKRNLLSETTKIKIGLANKGKKGATGEKANNWKGGKPKCNCGTLIGYNSKQCKECYLIKLKDIHFLKGFRHKKSSIEKIRIANIGKKLSIETISKLKGKIAWNKGIKMPQKSGCNNHRWIIDRTLLKDDSKDRGGQFHREWSKLVKDRDIWSCRIADINCGGRLESHHILGWSSHPELRYKLNNGITLCQAHHPRKRAEEKRLISTFRELVSVSNS